MEQNDEFDRGAVRFKRSMPYMARAFSAMDIIFTDKVKHMEIAKNWKLYVNPQGLLDDDCQPLPPGEVGYMVATCVQAALRRHWKRIGSRDAPKWGLSTQVELGNDTINGLERPMDMPKPDDWKLKPNLLAEDYYQDLPDPPEAPVMPAGEHSSMVTNKTEEFESAKDDNELSEVEQEAIVRKTAQDIQDYAASKPGSVPGDLLLWANEHVEPYTPPDRLLRVALAQGLRVPGDTHHTYSRVKVRDGIVIPKKIGRSPRIVLMCDTSGSMGAGRQSRLYTALRWVTGIVRKYGPTTVVWCDAQVHVQKLRVGRDIKPKGGGGTVLTTGIRHIEEHMNPDLCVILTDGETDWPAKTSLKNVVTVIVTNDKHMQGPSFGKTLRITEKEMKR